MNPALTGRHLVAGGRTAGATRFDSSPASGPVRACAVGTLSIHRFLRPVCYRNMPEALLPAGLA